MAACAIAALTGWTGGVAAGQTIFDARRADFDPLGLRAGGFILLPSLTATAEWDDNIYRTAAAAVSDLVLRLKPSLSVESNWGSDALRLKLDADLRRHRDLEDEDVTDWSASLDYRLDVLRGARIYLSGGYAQEHEERGAPDQDALGAVRAPTPFTVLPLSARVVYDRGRLALEGGAATEQYRYEATERSGLPPIDNGDRDRENLRFFLRATYAFSPGYGAFAEAAHATRSFAQTPDRNGFDRDSDRTSLRAGVRFEVTRILTGEAFAGHTETRFEDPAFEGFGAADFGAALTWSPEPATSVVLDVRRSVEPTTLAGSSGVLDTRTSVTVEHEIARDLIAAVEAGYATQDFRQTDREDTTTSLAVRVRYFVHRHVAFDAGWAYETRDSSAPGAAYDDTRFTLGLRIHY